MSVYYYLLSGLKEYHLDDANKVIDLPAICSHILEQLDDKDECLFKYLVYQNDNKNLAHAITLGSNLYSPYDGYISPSVFDGTVFEHLGIISSDYPMYMQSFLDDGKNKDFTSIRDIENALQVLFLDEINACDSQFLIDYFSFIVDFKNIMTAINLRMLGYSAEAIKDNLFGDSVLVDALLKSTSSDFGVSKEYPYISKLLEAIEAKDPYMLETSEMEIVFDYLDNYTSSKFFSFDNVLAMYIKFDYIARLAGRDVVEGEKAVKTLMAEIKSKLDEVKV